MVDGFASFEELDRELSRRVDSALPVIERALSEYEGKEVDPGLARRLESLRKWRQVLLRLKTGQFNSTFERLRLFREFCASCD